MTFNQDFTPRNGHTFQIILPARVSDQRPGKQNRERSLGDQRTIQDNWIASHLPADLKYELKIVAGQGSGESIEREEYQELLRLIESQKYDLVLTEDLGRIVRGVEGYQFCNRCEDYGVQLIAINNGVDTANPNWRDLAFFTSYFYEKDNSDKSKRLKERLRARFEKGYALERRTYGYVDPPKGAKHESDRQKDPEAETVFKEWFQRLDQGVSYSEIADWLNEQGIPTGPHCRNKEWNCKMVDRLTHNPILKGQRERGRTETRRVNSTGKYKRFKADEERLLIRKCPHLAFFAEDYYDRVTYKVIENNAKFKPGKNGVDPRKNRPKSKTAWPGQHIYCGECGRLIRYGGHGQTKRLFCAGAYDYKCWNSITVDGPLAAQKISAAVFAEIAGLSEFDENLLSVTEDSIRERQQSQNKRLSQVQKSLKNLEQRLDNLIKSIEEYGPSQEIGERIRELKSQRAELLEEQFQLKADSNEIAPVPTVHELREIALDAFQGLAIDSQDFSRVIRKIIPRMIMYPVQLVDGGMLKPRIAFQLDLTTFAPISRHDPELSNTLKKRVVVDTFGPPERALYRERVNEGKKQGLTEREIARELGTSQSVVQYAASLQRKMDSLQVTDPYQIVLTPPLDTRRYRRHLHKRYKYDPLPYVEIS